MSLLASIFPSAPLGFLVPRPAKPRTVGAQGCSHCSLGRGFLGQLSQFLLIHLLLGSRFLSLFPPLFSSSSGVYAF